LRTAPPVCGNDQAAVIGYIVSEGRVLSLIASEWLMLVRDARRIANVAFLIRHFSRCASDQRQKAGLLGGPFKSG
jgi:hypothetical protein